MKLSYIWIFVLWDICVDTVPMHVHLFYLFPSGWGPHLSSSVRVLPPSSDGPALLRPALSPGTAPLWYHPSLHRDTHKHTRKKKRGCMIRTGDRTRGRWNKNKTPPHRLLLSRIVKAVRVYTKPPTSVSRSLFKLVITAILGGSHSADEVMHPTGLCELWNDLICALVDRSSWCG